MKLLPRFFRSDSAPVKVTRADAYARLHTALAHEDTWVNPGTNLGASAASGGVFFRDNTLNYEQLTSLYNFSDIAKRIIDTRPKEMFRKGYSVALKDQESDDRDIQAKLAKRAKELKVDKKVADGIRWGRLYGGAIGILNTDDARPPMLPLLDDTAKLKSITILDRRYCVPMTYYGDPLEDKYGEVETFMICAQVYPQTTKVANRSGTVIHESRVLQFKGAPTDQAETQRLGGWCHSALQAPYDAMRKFAQAFEAAGVMLNDASQGVFKMEGLIDTIGNKHFEAIMTRMQLVDQSRSVARALLIDSKEEFEKVPTNFQDIPDVLDRVMMRMSAAADTPVTLLMGRSPAGENATGESDFRAFYDSIANEQRAEMVPALERIYGFLLREVGAGERDFDIELAPLWEATAGEQADIRLKQAQADDLYIKNGVLYPAEVAIGRFGHGKWSPNVEIDVEERTAELETEKAMGSPMDVQTEAAKAMAPEPAPTDEAKDDEPPKPGAARST